MYMYIYIYIYTCMYIYIYIYIYVRVHWQGSGCSAKADSPLRHPLLGWRLATLRGLQAGLVKPGPAQACRQQGHVAD